ncbi:MAG: hypothetical protein U0Q22_16445 [Acidimicrobiales bacterium]
MTVQLLLIDTEPEWKIPETTRQIGRRGLAEARAVLRQIPRRDSGEGTGAAGDDARQHPAAA